MQLVKKWRTSLLDVRNKRGADINSDHHLMIANLKIKIKAAKTKYKQQIRRFNVQKLQKKNIKEIFQIQTRNHYELLGEMQDNDEDEEVEQQWRRVKEIWNKTAEETLGYKNVHGKD